jgi:hypothetical protein
VLVLPYTDVPVVIWRLSCWKSQYSNIVTCKKNPSFGNLMFEIPL